jgi:predicted nucleic acid-binding protein
MAGGNPKKYLVILEEFLNDKSIITSPGLARDSLDYYTEIYLVLRKQGTPVSPNDLWIAAECTANSLSLATFDKDFNNIPQLSVISPT